MFKIAATSAALAALLAGAVHAQTQTAPAAEPATPPAMTAPADATTPAVPGDATPPAATTATEGWAPVDLATISTEQLVGADLVNFEGETIATIDDVLIANDMVEGVVVTFGGVLGFGAQKVLLQPTEIEVMRDASDTLMVRTSLAPEAIEQRPAYEES